MIRKTLFLCLSVVTTAFLSLNACTSNVKADATPTELSKIVHDQELKHAREQKSVWETELADESRFTLNLVLTNQEKAIAKKFARTVTHNLKRNELFVHYLLTALKDNDLPLELAAIPLLESGLNPYARSTGGAHGAWQYIRSTGKSLGLHRTENYDGIYDFFASTDAGIKYLKKLYADLGDWELVAVAYNRGEYGTKKAIQRALDRGIKNPNAENMNLSRSSKGYLMRFKAYSDVLKNPSLYGVSLPKIKNRPAFKKVEVADRINSLNEAARLSGAQIDVLKKLNSGYTGDKIDAVHGIYMPIDKADNLEKAISSKGSVASNTKLSNSLLIETK